MSMREALPILYLATACASAPVNGAPGKGEPPPEADVAGGIAQVYPDSPVTCVANARFDVAFKEATHDARGALAEMNGELVVSADAQGNIDYSGKVKGGIVARADYQDDLQGGKKHMVCAVALPSGAKPADVQLPSNDHPVTQALGEINASYMGSQPDGTYVHCEPMPRAGDPTRRSKLVDGRTRMEIGKVEDGVLIGGGAAESTDDQGRTTKRRARVEASDSRTAQTPIARDTRGLEGPFVVQCVRMQSSAEVQEQMRRAVGAEETAE